MPSEEQEKIPDTIDQFEEIYLDFIAEKQVFYAELLHRLTRHQFSTTLTRHTRWNTTLQLNSCQNGMTLSGYFDIEF